MAASKSEAADKTVSFRASDELYAELEAEQKALAAELGAHPTLTLVVCSLLSEALALRKARRKGKK